MRRNRISIGIFCKKNNTNYKLFVGLDRISLVKTHKIRYEIDLHFFMRFDMISDRKSNRNG